MSSSPGTLQRAVECHRQGQLAAAGALYREVLKANPRQPDALHLLGLIVQHEGNVAQAIELFDAAIAADPRVAAFHLNRGLALRNSGKANEALEDFNQATLLDPGLADAHHHKGNVLKAQARFREAIAALQAAAKLAPINAAVRLNLGLAYLEDKQVANAVNVFRQAIQLEPDRPEAHNVLGHALSMSGDFFRAEAAYKAALQLEPQFAPAHDNLGRLFKSQARIPEALYHYRAALKIRPSAVTHSNLLLALNFSDLPPSEIFLEHCKWAKLYGTPLYQNSRKGSRFGLSDRRLRVGYVSPDFVNHAVAHFIEPILRHHDRNRFEVFCYSDVLTPDEVTVRLRKQSEHWENIAGIPDKKVAELVQRDRIDVLVDLAGHTAGNRLLVFARKPAALQVTWIGYPNTTGLPEIDYRITDAAADPIGKTEHLHSEKLLRLPECFSCYLPSPNSPPVSELPANKSGYVTFGSFNQLPKLSPAVLELWARVLRELPTARLLLRARGLADDATSARLRDQFSALGIDAQRVDLDGRELSVAAHQGAYQHVDIGLDPFPYNGTTTTCEALWSGIPVVTLAGLTHVSRVGASLLTHIGATDWIATSADEYVQHCVALASNLTQLASIRAGLRSRFLSSPLGDAPRFTRHLESAYTRIWEEYCRIESVPNP